MRIDIANLSGSNILAGAMSGRELLSKLMLVETDNLDPQIVFLDFVGIDVATGSFLREGVLGYRDFTRARQTQLYPVVANPNPQVLEELAVILGFKNEALMCCSLDTDLVASEVRVLGKLDPKQKRAFELIKLHGPADAGTLRSACNEDSVQTTAWNNRLASLCNQGLLIETNQGRRKIYRPLFEEAW